MIMQTIVNGSAHPSRPTPSGGDNYNNYISKRIRFYSSGNAKNQIPTSGDEYRDYIARNVQQRVNMQHMVNQERLVRIIRLEVEKMRANEEKLTPEQLHEQIDYDYEPEELREIYTMRNKLIAQEKYAAIMKDIDDLEESIKTNKKIVNDKSNTSSTSGEQFLETLYNTGFVKFPTDNKLFYVFILMLVAFGTFLPLK